MAMTNNYITLNELKGVLDIDTMDTASDTILETAIVSVCRMIDAKAGRRFYTTTASETRVYSPNDYDLFFSPVDINTLTTLKTDTDGDGVFETTWATSDYSLEPRNAALDGKPYTYIVTKPNGANSFPKSVPNSIQLVGKFGWGATSATPDVVRQAALIQSSRIFLRKNAPFGILGSGEFGTVSSIPKLDPDVEELLKSVTRMVP